MMSLASIHARNHQTERIAKHKRKKPVCIETLEQLEAMPPFPFPYLGNYCPPNYELVDKWFVDISGFGTDDEPALSSRRLCAKLRDTWNHHPEYCYAVISYDRFQGYLGVFRWVPTQAKAERLNHVLKAA